MSWLVCMDAKSACHRVILRTTVWSVRRDCLLHFASPSTPPVVQSTCRHHTTHVLGGGRPILMIPSTPCHHPPPGSQLVSDHRWASPRPLTFSKLEYTALMPLKLRTTGHANILPGRKERLGPHSPICSFTPSPRHAHVAASLWTSAA